MTSTLDLTGEEDPETGLGHGTRALGPSDSSDSGSDVVGGPGMDEGLSDEQARRMPLSTTQGAGRDLGDTALDSDSDRAGTGERGGSGVEGSLPNDQVLSVRSDADLDEGMPGDTVAVTADLDLITPADAESEERDDSDQADGPDDAPMADGAT